MSLPIEVRMKRVAGLMVAAVLVLVPGPPPAAQPPLPVPREQRGRIDAERAGFHDAARIRTVFWNYGMVGDYPPDPGNVDLSVFHSAEVPKGSGLNYTDGITPFVLAKIVQTTGDTAYIMETGYRERQGISPFYNRVMRFEPRPGYFQADPGINRGRSPAISNDPRTWPPSWPDKLADPDDPGWSGQWNGYFGKRPAADQESFTVMDDDFYDGWDYFPDSRDPTRHGLGLRVEVRGFQWANPQAGNVIFWHYDITNEVTVDYVENVIFGLYMDSGVGGSALSCDGVYESDDDNAYFDKSSGLNLVYTWDKYGHGVDLSGPCGRTGYLGYAYLETPGKPLDGLDNDGDGIVDEQRDGGPGQLIVGQQNIRDYAATHYDLAKFETFYGPIEKRPAFRAGRWWTGDEDLDWLADLNDFGADGVAETGDTGEGDGVPTEGETNFDRTDLNESDQIGLTGFKMNRIRAGAGNPDPAIDDILFFTNNQKWPERLYKHFTDPNPAARFDSALAANYNIGFLFASGPFTLLSGKRERFSLALGYGLDLPELRNTVRTVQQIYNANYQFAVPPPAPTVTAEAGDGYVRLAWDDVAERGVDPVTGDFDFEGYKIYRSTDPEFRDPQIVPTGSSSIYLPNGKPLAVFDLADERRGWSKKAVEGTQYWLGEDSGLAHTWTDNTVTNGQRYYYAVCAYDYGYDPGPDSLAFFPSENSIPISRTPRGGLILPSNAVDVRPNPKVSGYLVATADTAVHVAGDGSGTVKVEVVNSALIPDGHLFKIQFATTSPESVHANTYALVDSTTHKTLFTYGKDFRGESRGPVGGGLLPVIQTDSLTSVDEERSGYDPGGSTNTRLKARYIPILSENLRRTGYPDDMTITFDAVVRDTGVAIFPVAAFPAKFIVTAHTAEGDRQMDFVFRDRDGDGTLSRPDERIDILCPSNVIPDSQLTWRAQLDTVGQGARGPIRPPGLGDVFQLRLKRPFNATDVFTFTTGAERVDRARAEAEFQEKPYVVPNPYVGAASFESEKFAVSGRGERRIEFRALPQQCTIRIYTVRGDLVQTLHQDGSTAGYVAWNLRTKDNLDVAPGLYIYHVEAPGVGNHVGKFAIIK